MGRRIYKYPLLKLGTLDFPEARSREIQMPKGAIPRHLGIQDATIALWADVNPQAEPESRTFVLAGTGEEIPEDVIFVATVIAGAFVWHLFDDRNPYRT